MKYRIFTIVGARPQFIKAAALSRSIRQHFSDQLQETIVHTGQHYDAGMSDVFFEELEIPPPEFHLQVGSAGHGRQTGTMMQSLEDLMLSEKPDLILVYGDTNSTLAGALTASKIHIPVVHVEAGLRSFNKGMPEEINRILTDHVSTLLFTPTKAGLNNLKKEGFSSCSEGQKTDMNHPAVFHCGDVMFDNALYFKSLALKKASSWFSGLPVSKGKFLLATIHRNANTDDPERLKSILQGMMQAARRMQAPVLLPLHPRTQKMLDFYRLSDSFFGEIPEDLISILPPVSYLQMVFLESQCEMVLTDSGGVQKEAYFYEKPCIVLRPETEWVELVESGAAVLADADAKKIEAAVIHFSGTAPRIESGFYGDGKAADFIAGQILKFLISKGA